MKYLTVLLLCTVIILTGCESKQEVTDAQLEQIIETINEMEERRSELFDDYEVNPDDSLFLYPEREQGLLVKVVGENDTFDAVCNNMSDLCSPEVAEKLIQEIYMYNVNGELYMYAAAGLQTFYPISDISDIRVISVNNSAIELEIDRICWPGDTDYFVCRYVAVLESDSVHIQEYENLYFVTS